MNSASQTSPPAKTRIGTFQGFEPTHGQFGQQYSTIDGAKFITFFDLANPRLKELRAGCRIEFSAMPAPTVLCHHPHVQESLPCGAILRVLPQKGGGA